MYLAYNVAPHDVCNQRSPIIQVPTLIFRKHVDKFEDHFGTLKVTLFENSILFTLEL